MIPLGYDIIECDCGSLKFSNSCKAGSLLRKPMHLKLCDDFLIPSKTLTLFNPSVTIRNIDGQVTYISNDFETNTLISETCLCEILPHFSDSVSECPSF